MSRSGYTDDSEFLNLYRATVERALHGKRGQYFLKELAVALDSLPQKRLIYGELINASGECCTIGAICKSRQIDVSKIDYEDPESVAKSMGISTCMAAEIAYMNDDGPMTWENPEERWIRMREWVTSQIQESK